jgi:hypothetical protein
MSARTSENVFIVTDLLDRPVPDEADGGALA